MASSEDYRRYAAECLEVAPTMTDPQVIATLRYIARAWLRLADRRYDVYRSYAAECMKLATTMVDPQTRATLTQMAQEWLRLADRKHDTGNTSKTAE
jgi:hypothetical protein